MLTTKIRPHGGTHRILHALSIQSHFPITLKRLVGANNSIKRFEDVYCMHIQHAGLIRRNDDVWELTELGVTAFAELGPAQGMDKFKKATPRKSSFLTERDYSAEAIRKSPRRPGSDTYLKYPSRFGDRLSYPKEF